MEKYKRFTDAATGINPFVPPVPPGAVRVLLGALAAPVAAFLVGIAWILYVLLGVIPFAIAGAAASPLHMVTARLFGALFMTLFGWSKPSKMSYPARASALNKLGDDVATPAAGDVVFANAQSPLDLVALQWAFPWRPITFVFPLVASDPKEVSDAESFIERASIAGAMTAMLSKLTQPANSFELPAGHFARAPRPIDLAPIQRRAKKAGRIVVCFAEGATTNGRGLLRMAPATVDKDLGFHVVGIAHSNTSHAAVLPVEAGPFNWIFSSLLPASVFRMSTTDVTVVRPSQRPPAPPASFSGEWAAALQAKLGQAVSFNRPTDAPCRPLASSGDDKTRFLCQWGQYNS